MKNQRYFLHLAYKGTNFFGWQIQAKHQSVQAVIESALASVHSNREIAVTGCGRTDTGVHASNFYAHFDSDLDIEKDHFIYKLNSLVGDDIVIKDLIPVDPKAHARFDATARTYHYFIHQKKDPFAQETSWFNKQELALDKMNKACLILQNHTDFQCFSKVNTEMNNFNCEIGHARWIQSEKGIIFRITANRFLRNMVRAIVGTMIEIGLEKIEVNELTKILESKDRSMAGESVPAQGLFLADVRYPYLKSEGSRLM
ncbi:tRNA pseudouridine(38-40) synthase TruA [Crocinitomix catalasitica]|nr:tRNA pseudouridine(38-40) synthase TruA [Crocinitomix catalasitica]